MFSIFKLLKKFIILVFFLILQQAHVLSGEPGELPEEIKEETKVEEVIEPKVEEKIEEEAIETEIVNEPEEKKEGINLDTKIPKNRMVSIYNQKLGEKIDFTKITLIGKCEPRFIDEQCKIVIPKTRSRHFNRYYYYLTPENKVYAIISSYDKRLGSYRHCKKILNDWEKYFMDHYSFEKTTNNEIEDYFILTDAPERKPIEIHMSCQFKNTREIQSYLYLSVFKKP